MDNIIKFYNMYSDHIKIACRYALVIFVAVISAEFGYSSVISGFYAAMIAILADMILRTPEYKDSSVKVFYALKYTTLVIGSFICSMLNLTEVLVISFIADFMVDSPPYMSKILHDVKANVNEIQDQDDEVKENLDDDNIVHDAEVLNDDDENDKFEV